MIDRRVRLGVSLLKLQEILVFLTVKEKQKFFGPYFSLNFATSQEASIDYLFPRFLIIFQQNAKKRGTMKYLSMACFHGL